MRIASRKVTGFSLIELLIAVIVFSVGVLAVAGLQTVSKQSNYESLQRTTASHVAHGILEDMRTNGSAINTYLASPNLGGGVIADEPVPNCSSMAAECNATQKALHDLWFWEDFIDGSHETGAAGASGGLISPTICVAGPEAGSAGIYIVSIVWRGVVSMSSDVPNQCGAGSGLYGDGDEFRRVMTIPTFIDPAL
jgi:type IV pilus assembly protein PilV